MTDHLSPGLQKYRETLVDPAPEHLRKGTWIPLARWVAKNIPQDIILQVSVELWRELSPISQASGGTTEETLADAIRDATDVTWYAMAEETIAKFNEAIVPYLKPDERVTA